MTRRILGVTLAACCALAGCGDDETESSPPGGDPPVNLDCGGVVCAEHSYCDRDVTPPVCRCSEGYTGDQCDYCAAGYLPTPDGRCEQIIIDCEVDPLICGDHGSCVDLPGESDGCECENGYDGVLCERCAEGYQNNAGDGICREGCELAGLQCDPPEVCRDDSGEPICDCPEGMIGDECDLCATGYHDPLGTGTCTPTCELAALSCEDGLVCDDSQGEPACSCPPGYTGTDCSECASGYQDNALDGSCRPGCEVAGEDCSDHGTCSAASGWPTCTCDMGWAGFHCDTCDVGYEGAECDDCRSTYNGQYYRVGDGPCMPGCSVAGVDCSGNGTCVEAPTDLECRCEVGFAGQDCASCRSGYTSDGQGHCLASPQSQHTLLAVGYQSPSTHAAEPYLVGIDPIAGSFDPLRPIDVRGDMAADIATSTLYVGGGAISTVDVTTGQATATPVTRGTYERGLTWDPSRQVLWSYRVSYRDIVGVTPAGVVQYDQSVSGVALTGGYRIAYRAANDALYMFNQGYETAVVDLDTYVATAFDFQIPTLVGVYFQPHNSIGDGAIAFAGGTDRLFVVGKRQRSDQEAMFVDCVEAAKWLGLGDYASAIHQQHEVGPISGEVVLDAAGANQGIVTYYSPDPVTSGSPVLSVATNNPEAVVCISVDQEPLLLRIRAGARFKAVIADFDSWANVQLEVESGFPTPASPSVHLYVPNQSAVDPSILAYPAVARAYDSWDWSQRNLPRLIYPSTSGPGVLLEVDPTSGALLSQRELDGYFPIWDMTGW
ncbi:MAG: hypothetical protein JRI23_01090 [Deltaproteobacteria bacterium]|jgi:hypothetical protein|nr:hypothetical protein [Deltaproteobacteria bacterium]MBW2530049.1 hypothetical protein [Deltaproteobacteria bacterium]